MSPANRGRFLDMSLDADLIVDRRRMRRKLTFWRVFAVLILIAAVVAVAASVGRSDVLSAGSDYIARVKITGLIRNDQDRVDSLEKLAKSSARSEEHTSELQSRFGISYPVFCLKK